MQVRRFFPLLFVTSAVCALTACPSSDGGFATTTSPPPPARGKFVFRGSAGPAYTSSSSALLLWATAMTVTPTSYGYTLSQTGPTQQGSGLLVPPVDTLYATVDDSAANVAATAKLSDLFNSKVSFGCSSGVTTTQDTKIAVFDRLVIPNGTDLTHYLSFDQVASNGSIPVHHMLFYAQGAGRAAGTTSCTFSGAGGTGAVTSTTTTDVTVKPGWNLYTDSATTSTNAIETITSNDTTYKGPYKAN